MECNATGFQGIDRGLSGRPVRRRSGLLIRQCDKVCRLRLSTLFLLCRCLILAYLLRVLEYTSEEHRLALGLRLAKMEPRLQHSLNGRRQHPNTYATFPMAKITLTLIKRERLKQNYQKQRITDADGTRTHSLCHRKATRYHYATTPSMKMKMSYSGRLRSIWCSWTSRQ